MYVCVHDGEEPLGVVANRHDTQLGVPLRRCETGQWRALARKELVERRGGRGNSDCSARNNKELYGL